MIVVVNFGGFTTVTCLPNIAITPPIHVCIVSMNFVQRLFESEKDASDRNSPPEIVLGTNKAILYF